METKNQIFNPFDLIQRTEPQKKRDYIVKIIPEQPVDILTEEQETTEVLIKDKRKNSMNLVERSLILNRIRAAIPVEQTMLSKSPVNLSQPINETELDTISDTIENEKNYEIVEKKIQDAIQETPMEKSKTLDEDALMDLEILQDAEPSKPVEAVKQPTKKTTAKKRPVKDVAEKEKRTGAPVAVTAARQKLTMGVSSYYMNNRKLFIQQLSKLFKPYHDKIAEKGQEITCNTAKKSSIDFDLLTHQLVVRDYLNLYTPYRGLLLYHGLGSGKCHKINTPIMMSDGSIKMVQDIKVGDMLMGDDSQPRTVLSLARGRDKMYDVIPIKCDKYTVNQEHILCLRASGFPKISYNTHKSNTNYNIQWIENNKFMSKTFTYNSENQLLKEKEAYTFFENIQNNSHTKDNVYEIAIKDYLLLSKKQKGFLKGYKVPIDFPEKKIPIDPYMIGYWLGDGTSCRSEITCNDSTVLYYFAKNLQKYNLSLNYHDNYVYGISGNGKYNNNIFLNSLKDLQLINNKHIPDIFKFNSREIRLQILAGLIDSDGHYDNKKNIFEFTQKNEKLMDDVIYLCRSLGFACYKHIKKTSWTYNGIKKKDTAFRINISGIGIENIPTIIPRKKSLPRKQIKDVLVSGIKVEYVNEDDYYGFMLDGNCRYLMGDFTVTHNTCTSIGIAEGMKSDKKLILMTPASLKMNFFSELKKCGDVLFRKNNFWEFISIEGEPDNKKMLSDTLGIPKEYVQEKKGAWMADIKKEPNFSNLSDNDQKNIDEQLNLMIRNKYQDINYNGLTKNKMDEFTNHGKTNPFHHSVIIIEEAHNLVSRIANSLKKKKSIAYQLYQLLMDATDVKVIFLTGTPIINHPREIGILFNMLRGFIKTWTFQIQTTTTEKLNRDILLDYFKKENFALYDYVEYSGDKLIITRNPFGFVNMYKKRIGGGSEEIDGGANRGANKHTGTRKRREKLEPSANYTRKSSLTDDTDDTDDIADEEIVDIEHQYDELNKNLYEGGGGTGGASGAFEEYSGVRLDEMGNVSDAKFQSKITDILQKYNINIVGKPKVVKELCLPDDENLFKELFINNQKGELSNVDLLKRRILGLTSYFRSAQEQLLPRFVKNEKGGNYHLMEVDMSQHQFDIYSERRKEERDDEKRQRKGKKQAKDDDDSAFVSTYRIYSRSACNFAFPSEYPRPMIRTEEVKTLEDFDGIEKEVLQNKDDYFEEEQVAVTTETTTLADFQTRVKETYDALATKDFLKKRELHKYSPKFLQILESIQDEKNKGLHLLYSQFRTLEGIGIFKLVLESNGFAEFKITKKTGKWTIENADVDPEKPRFVLYTGTETAEEKEIIRNIYNSAWEFVPPSILETLRTKHENNFYGEVIKVLMITSSGAEGINLRNTRFVHIVEPYWNMVRIDQVVGRARRICSHEDLPDNLRTVQVFVYISKMTNEQLVKNIEMKTQDTSKLEYPVKKDGGVIKMERVPFSTDQYLFEIAQIKDSINTKILTAVKETAIDCSLYNTNPEEPLVCYGFGKVASNNFGSYPVLETDLSEKTEANVKTEKTVLVAVTVDGVKYAMDKKTRTVYDFESYKKAKEKRGELIKVGTLDMRTQTIIP